LVVIPRWFLYLNGFAMLLLGGALIATRPKRAGESPLQRWFGLRGFWSTLWSTLCLTVGVALLAMALGYWRGPMAPPPPPKSASPFRP
jgi:ABC-type Fe3+ transport system permease subunit